jgi:serine protease inhibitor
MPALCVLPLMLLAGGAPPANDEVSLARSSNAFAFDLYRRLGPGGDGNRAISPASVSTALSMAWAGARGGTAMQMQSVLRFEAPPDVVMQASGRLALALQDPARGVVFRIANRMFGEKTCEFEPAYMDATRAAFGAALEPVDFKRAAEKSRLLINGWVEEKTEKRIRDLVPPGGVDKEARLVLVNAIYFLGDWAEPFEKESTRPAPFTVSASQKKDVPTMHAVESFRFAARDASKAVELPYKGGQFSMLLVLPDADAGLPVLEATLTAERLEGIVKSLAPTRVHVSLPKFEVDPPGSLALGEVLAGLGMPDAFSPAQADFTAIANPPDPRDRLFLSEVFHKAFVKVDEKGTEAAAATAAVMARAAAAMAPPAEFKADHPFLFFIRDNATGMILFMGRVADPSSK